MKNKNLYIFSEESPMRGRFQALLSILDISGEFEIKKTDDLNCLAFEITGSKSKEYEKIYYVIGNFNKGPDHFFFESDSWPDLKHDTPSYVIEETNYYNKNGNMLDQRGKKFIQCIERWGYENTRYSLWIRDHKEINETINNFSDGNHKSISCLRAMGVTTIVSSYEDPHPQEVEPKYDYNNLEIFLQNESESPTKKNSIHKLDSKYTIECEIYQKKSKLSHDPNRGWLATRHYVLRKLVGPDTIIDTGNCLNYIKSLENKITLDYNTTGEKLATIMQEYDLHNNSDFECIFTNHGGSAKSPIKIPYTNEYITVGNEEGIPDLISFEWKTKTIHITEGKTKKNIKEGLKQISHSGVDKVIERILEKIPLELRNDIKIKKGLCIFGISGEQMDLEVAYAFDLITATNNIYSYKNVKEEEQYTLEDFFG